MSFACCILAAIRVYLKEDYSYLFLIWNLFLAWVPLIIVFYLKKVYLKIHKKYFLLVSCCMIWLLFFPNSPYIITDLIHINPEQNGRAWYDAILIFSFALTGLIAGFISLYLLHEILDSLFNKYLNWSIILLIFLLSGYGIYLGRVLRWNSWDLFIHPKPLLSDVTKQIENPEAIFMTAVLTFFMIFSYLILHSLINLKYQEKENDQNKKMPE
jgi:uncharacterized membrane protein